MRENLYLAGPMRGIAEFNFPAFFDKAIQLRSLGYDVFSPAERDVQAHGNEVWEGRSGDLAELAHDSFDLRAALAADMKFISETADGVAVLPGWEASSGARAEVSLALALGLPVASVVGWIAKDPGPNTAWWDERLIRSVPDPSQISVYAAPAALTETPKSGGVFDAADWAGHIEKMSDPYQKAKERAIEATDPFHDPHRYIGLELPTVGEVRTVNPTTGGQKGSKLARYDLIPVGPLTELAEHYGRGSLKYDDRNWELGYAWGLSYAALLRHVTSFWGGEDIDPETGGPHLAAVAWHALALREWAKTHPELDDRPGSLAPDAGS